MLTTRFPRSIPAAALNRTVDQLVNSVFNDLPTFEVAQRRFPSINVWEDAQHLYVEAEVPGFSIGELNITITGNELTISGTRAQAKPDGAAFVRRERPFGTFSRTLRVSTEVDSAKVGATLVNGVLTITLPKAEAVKPRKIEVKAN